MFNVLKLVLVHTSVRRYVSPFRSRINVLSPAMAQKSITSFFSRAPSQPAQATPTKNKVKVDSEDSCSPLKIGNKSSKRLRIESDSDSDSPPEKRNSVNGNNANGKSSPVTVKKENDERETASLENDLEMDASETSENVKVEKNVSPKAQKTDDISNDKKVKSPAIKQKVSPKSKKEKTSSKNIKNKSPLSNKTEDKLKKTLIGTNEFKDENKDEDSLKVKKVNVSQEDIKNNCQEITEKKKPQGLQGFFTTKSTKTDDKTEKNIVYDPTKTKYHPIDDAIWSQGDKVPYLALARTLEEIEKISARLKIIEVLSNFLRSVIVLSPNDLLPSVYLCLNKLAPAYESVELGIAETTLMKAIAQTTGRSMAQIKNDCNGTGDIGLVAEQSKSNQRMMFQPAPLTVRAVFDKLKDIAQMSGHASMAKKVDKIQSMFVACRFSEARFLIRSLAGKLRIGLAEQSVLQALAQACTTTPPLATQEGDEWPPKVLNASKGLSQEQFKAMVDEQALILKTVYCECPNYDMIIPIILEHGIEGLPKHCRLTPGIPLKPMLAHPTKGVQEVLQRFENVEFTCEWKYDGERAQIHVPSIEKDGKLTCNVSGASIYSRNQENNTTKYPDIINRLEKTLKDTVTSCILDCEAVAWDKEKKTIMPFQVLSTRKKKDANEADIKVAVCIFMFDLLYLNGEALVKKPFEERRKLLRENFNMVDGEWHMATSLDCSTIESIQEFLEESVKGNCEGLMVKTLNGKDATYEIAKRSRNWLKLKKDYLEGVGDTIDAVVIGGYLGRGKRTGVYGGFLLACYDKDTDEYQSLCKIGTGFSDQDLQDHSKSLAEHVIPAPKGYYRYDSSLEPDNWFDAVQVWEIKCADLSLSPIHRAAMGIVDPEKGISLRFPRFIRIRDDKTAENATSAQQIAELYCNQDQVKNQTSNTTKNIEDDFY